LLFALASETLSQKNSLFAGSMPAVISTGSLARNRRSSKLSTLKLGTQQISKQLANTRGPGPQNRIA